MPCTPISGSSVARQDPPGSRDRRRVPDPCLCGVGILGMGTGSFLGEMRWKWVHGAVNESLCMAVGCLKRWVSPWCWHPLSWNRHSARDPCHQHVRLVIEDGRVYFPACVLTLLGMTETPHWLEPVALIEIWRKKKLQQRIHSLELEGDLFLSLKFRYCELREGIIIHHSSFSKDKIRG